MTRSPNDWRESARSTIEDTTNGVEGMLDTQQAEIAENVAALRETALAEDPDRKAVRGATDDLTDALKALGHAAFDQANEVRKIRSGATIRNLQGKEPIGYSKPDGGGTHDAVYGSKAMNRNFSRHVSWPLQLNEWEKTRCDRTRDGIDPVSANGTTKYTKTVGGRQVALVVDERGMEPI